MKRNAKLSGFKKLRLLAAKSLTEAAKELGVNYTTVRNWELGIARPNPKKFKKISEVYGCSIEDIVAAYETQD